MGMRLWGMRRCRGVKGEVHSCDIGWVLASFMLDRSTNCQGCITTLPTFPLSVPLKLGMRYMITIKPSAISHGISSLYSTRLRIPYHRKPVVCPQ